MSEVVVNVNLAFKWVVKEHDSADAVARLRHWDQHNTRILVPGWFACELGNAIHQRVRGGVTSPQQAAQAIRFVLQTVTLLDPDPQVTVRAVEIAVLLNQRASYDSQYVALAEHLGCELWTADERFGRAAQSTFPFVHWLGEPATLTGMGQAGP